MSCKSLACCYSLYMSDCAFLVPNYLCSEKCGIFSAFDIASSHFYNSTSLVLRRLLDTVFCRQIDAGARQPTVCIHVYRCLLEAIECYTCCNITNRLRVIIDFVVMTKELISVTSYLSMLLLLHNRISMLLESPLLDHKVMRVTVRH